MSNEDNNSLNPFLEAVEGLGLNYEMAPIDQEYSTFTGVGAEPLDFKSYAKDIPCQASPQHWFQCLCACFRIGERR